MLFTEPSKAIQALNFTNGLFGFSVKRPNAADAGAVTVVKEYEPSWGGIAHLEFEDGNPEGTTPTTYYRYVLTPDVPTAHWYEFMYDNRTGTGAEIDGNRVSLHFIDDKLGDSDLTVNGVITDPGAPAQKANISSSGGGGCSIGARNCSPAQAGAWWILIALMPVLRRKRAYVTRTGSRSTV